MRTSGVLYVLLKILFINIAAGQSDSQCLIPITDRDYSNDGYFRYCNVDGVMTRQRGRDPIICDDKDKLKLLNFNAFVPKNPKESKCQRINKLRYKMKEDTSCLSPSQRDDIAFPFLTALSGKTAGQAKKMASKTEIRTGRYHYKQIALEVGCETDSHLKVDMCKPGSSVFPENANVSLYFNPATFHENTNHSSCYCYFKTYNTSMKILARAFDIRLHHHTQLLLDSHSVAPDRMYWWQTGVMSSGLAVVKLSGLSPRALPDSVWIDVYGRNMNITCDVKPLVVKGLVTNSPGKFATPSSGGLGTVYIAIIIIVGIVVFIIGALVVKVFCSRFTNASKSGAYKVDDPYASETFISSTYEKGDDPPSPHDPVVIYSKVGNKKRRKGGESDERHLYDLDSETEQEDTLNTSVVSADHKFSHDALVHTHPCQLQPPHVGDDGTNIYNHFQDHPDVVPTHSSPNIYSSTTTGVYSSFLPQRQTSKQENAYGLP